MCLYILCPMWVSRDDSDCMLQLLVAVVGIAICQAEGEYAVLTAEDEANTHEFCTIYFPEFKPVPVAPSSLGYLPLLNLTAHDACKEVLSINLSGKLVLVRPASDCTYDQIVVNFKSAYPTGILISTPRSRAINVVFQNSTIAGADMVVGFISETSVDTIASLAKPKDFLMTKMSTQKYLEFDVSLIIIWCLAVFTVAVGSYWSGVVKHELYQHESGKCTNPYHITSISASAKEIPTIEADIEEESSIKVTPLAIVLFVFTMGGMLMMLYFFFQYLVYFIIVMFAVASVVSVIGVLEPVVYMVPIGTSTVPDDLCPCFYGPLEVRQVALVAFAVMVSGTWVIFRHHPESWILQDILGVAFSVNMLKTLRLPSLMIITVLLTMLFFYDIFFVFITPYLTVKGESIMVEVARGTGSQEKLPVVLKVPHLSNQAISVCLGRFSLLGYGDMLVPGLLVSYCHGFDLLFAQGCYYYVTATVFYGIGLVATFVGLYVMRMAQPALLYLVPATVIPILCMAWYRGHLSEIWNGILPPGQARSRSNSDLPSGSAAADQDSPRPSKSSSPDLSPEEKSPLRAGYTRPSPRYQPKQYWAPAYGRTPGYAVAQYTQAQEWGGRCMGGIPDSEQDLQDSGYPLWADGSKERPLWNCQSGGQGEQTRALSESDEKHLKTDRRQAGLGRTVLG